MLPIFRHNQRIFNWSKNYINNDNIHFFERGKVCQVLTNTNLPESYEVIKEHLNALNTIKKKDIDQFGQRCMSAMISLWWNFEDDFQPMPEAYQYTLDYLNQDRFDAPWENPKDDDCLSAFYSMDKHPILINKKRDPSKVEYASFKNYFPHWKAHNPWFNEDEFLQAAAKYITNIQANYQMRIDLWELIDHEFDLTPEYIQQLYKSLKKIPYERRTKKDPEDEVFNTFQRIVTGISTDCSC